MNNSKEKVLTALEKLGYTCEIKHLEDEIAMDGLWLNGRAVTKIYQDVWEFLTTDELIEEMVSIIDQAYKDNHMASTILNDPDSDFFVEPLYSEFEFVEPEEYLKWDETQHRRWGIHLIEQLTSYDEITLEQIEWLFEYITHIPEMCLPVFKIISIREDSSETIKRFCNEIPMPTEPPVSFSTFTRRYFLNSRKTVTQKFSDWGLMIKYYEKEEFNKIEKYESIVEDMFDC